MKCEKTIKKLNPLKRYNKDLMNGHEGKLNFVS